MSQREACMASWRAAALQADVQGYIVATHASAAGCFLEMHGGDVGEALEYAGLCDQTPFIAGVVATLRTVAAEEARGAA